MNIKHKLTRLKRHGLGRNGLNRHGLSVIEVLTSIIVALIGVFGVLAMIPFSVRQTQSGLDQDAATSMARNALSSFEASGYKIATDTIVSGTSTKQLNWIDSIDSTGTGSNVTTMITPATSLVCIDPLGVAENRELNGGLNGGFNNFPFNSSMPIPIVIPTVTLARPGGPIPFAIADARRMFRLTDDVVFEQSDDPTVTDSDLLGPVQIFNEDAGVPVNRQSNGTISWCAIAEPIIADRTATEIESYKFNILVFKDRITDITVPESAMLAAPVLEPTTFGQTARVTIAEQLTEDIRRGDWVMLINQETGPGSEAQRTNISFARVTNLFSNDNGPSSLSLDGPDFQFTDSGLDPDGSGGPPLAEATYIVHLRDVVAVFPRTIRLETTSEWTVSAN